MVLAQGRPLESITEGVNMRGSFQRGPPCGSGGPPWSVPAKHSARTVLALNLPDQAETFGFSVIRSFPSFAFMERNVSFAHTESLGQVGPNGTQIIVTQFQASRMLGRETRVG